MNAVAEEVNTEQWPYCNDRVHLALYVEGSSDKTFPEEFLFALYAQCKKEHLLDVLFPGMPMVTAARFVAYLKDRPVLVGLVKDKLRVAGFAFLYEVEGDQKNKVLKATVGFCFFREWWGKREIREIALFAVKYWFEVIGLKVLFGTTRWDNRLAWRFAKNLGFESVGRVPRFFYKAGVLEDMHLMFLEPESFRGEF